MKPLTLPLHYFCCVVVFTLPNASWIIPRKEGKFANKSTSPIAFCLLNDSCSTQKWKLLYVTSGALKEAIT